MKSSPFLNAIFIVVAACCCRCALSQTTAVAEPPTSRPISVDDTRRQFLALIDRPKVELAPQIDEKVSDGAYDRYRFTYASEASQRVPGLLIAKADVLEDNGRHPAVIVLHGTTEKKESQLELMRMLAARDFIAISIDGRFHGERGSQADYNHAIAQAYTDGKTHPLYFDTVWDVMRLVDYLQSRSDVDPQRIGLMGVSKGGIETWLTTAADLRIKAAVPFIGLNSFAWGLDNNAWPARVGTFKTAFAEAAKSEGVGDPDAAFARKFFDRVIPGIYTTFDCPRMVELIAPRPLLAIDGDKDPLNPVPSARVCERAANDAYAAAGKPEQFELKFQKNTGHAVSSQAKADAVAWMVKWLAELGPEQPK